jgi:hemerythrin-like domain-containing protein
VGAEKIRTLEQALARYQQGGRAESSSFLAAVESYAAFHREHMRAEEQEALPMAEKYLSVSDWEAIDAAFLGHSDPMLGADTRTEFDKLFTRIVNMAPPPIGLGPERQRA